MDRTSEFAASTNGREGGWRGAGYNPNFENADEYPPRPEHVEAPSAKEIDLSRFFISNSTMICFQFCLVAAYLVCAYDFFSCV